MIKIPFEYIEYTLTLAGIFGLYVFLKGSKQLILTPELIPYTMHYKNVRAVLSQSDWQKIAKIAYRTSHYRCDICKKKGKLECHEIWQFDDQNLIQKLVGLTTLCPDCHRVKHIGLAKKMGWYPQAIQHMAKVNRISKSHAEKYVYYAQTEVKKRRAVYDLDLTYLNNYSLHLPRRYTSYENGSCQNINGNW